MKQIPSQNTKKVYISKVVERIARTGMSLLLAGATLYATPLHAAATGTVGNNPDFVDSILAPQDGALDGTIGQQYGSTRQIDIDFDGWCTNTGELGDLIDYNAYSASSAGSNQWYFSFVVDSSQAFDSGSYYSDPASGVSYIIPIDLSSNGTAANGSIDFQTAGSWRRNAKAAGDYFIALYPSGPSQLTAQLWLGDRSAMVGSSWTVTPILVANRWQVELNIPTSVSSLATGPSLTTNETMSSTVFSTQNSDFNGSTGGFVIDSANGISNCGSGIPSPTSFSNGGYGEFSTTFGPGATQGSMVGTLLACNSTTRPTDTGVTNDRQCTSLPARTTITPLAADANQCVISPAGLLIDGVINTNYTMLTEAGFAGPYQGGDSARSDFQGESSAYQYYQGTSPTTGGLGNLYTASDNAGVKGASDITGVLAYADPNYLYIIVDGPSALGGLGSMATEPKDFSNLFVAIDMPGVSSATNTGGTMASEAVNSPDGRRVNFKGWAPDYAIETVWAGDNTTVGASKLWSAAGAWGSSADFNTTLSTNTGSAGTGLYFGRMGYGDPTNRKGRWEYAIPWSNLGGKPASLDQIKLAVYTTGDSNVESGVNDWDVYDSASGIGQGCSGLGCHERLGDDPTDGDSSAQTGSESDLSLYVGQTDPTNNFEPASDRTTNDVDTIEEYFVFTIPSTQLSCLSSVLIGDHIWQDNGLVDGIYQATDTNLQGVVVTATSSTGVVYTDVTDANGMYTITVLPNATYTVTYSPVPMLSPSNAGTIVTSTATNDTNHTIGLSVAVTTTDNLNIDFALAAPPVLIGDHI